MEVLQIGRSLLVVGGGLIGGFVAMVVTGIAMLVADPGTVISDCHSATIHGGPEVCPSLSTFWEIIMTAGVVGTAGVAIGILWATRRRLVPFSN